MTAAPAPGNQAAKRAWLLDFCGLDMGQPGIPGGATRAAAPSSPSGQATPGQAVPGQATPGQAAPGQATPGQAAPDQAALALLNDPIFQHLVDEMEADAEEANDIFEAQAADNVFQYLVHNELADYRTDAAECEKAKTAFQDAWNNLAIGRGDVATLDKTYDIFSVKIGMLQQANARVEALITIDIAEKIKPLIAFLTIVSRNILALRIDKQIKALEAKLKKAESDVSDVKWKRRINIVVSAITLIAVPESALARLAIGAGGIAVHIGIDNLLGHGTAKGTVVFVAGDGAEVAEHMGAHSKELIEHLGEGGKKFFGAAATVVTAKFDTDELNEVKEVVESIRQDIEALHHKFDDLMKGILPLEQQFIELDTAMNNMNQAISTAMTAVGDAEKSYRDLQKELKKAAAA